MHNGLAYASSMATASRFLNRRADTVARLWVVGCLSLQLRDTIMQMPVLQFQVNLKQLHYADEVLQNGWG